jgi:hypothetical protein
MEGLNRGGEKKGLIYVGNGDGVLTSGAARVGTKHVAHKNSENDELHSYYFFALKITNEEFHLK